MAQRALPALLLLALLLPPGQAQPLGADRAPRCVGEDPPGDAAPPDASAALRALGGVVQAALQRSHVVGAARALADAAAADAEQTRAGGQWQAGLSARLGGEAGHSAGRSSTQPAQASAGLSLSRSLWDGGRLQSTLDWRLQLAEASRLAWRSQQEQVALSAVMLAMDRERYRAHEQVYGQYVRRMGCLVDALGDVVAADRGRASELLQARKALQQAELSRSDAQSQRRQTEVRLQRLLGESMPDTRALAQAPQELPPLSQLLAAAERSPELAQLEHQARAASHLAQALAADTRPQLSWSVTLSRASGWGGSAPTAHGGNVAAGVQISVPLLNPGSAPALDAARARALAAREQLEDAIESRRARVQELYVQAQSVQERAGRVGGILRDSQQLREATQLQWQQLGRRSLFDVMGSESEHYSLRIQQTNASFDARQLVATLQSLGSGLSTALP